VISPLVSGYHLRNNQPTEKMKSKTIIHKCLCHARKVSQEKLFEIFRKILLILLTLRLSLVKPPKKYWGKLSSENNFLIDIRKFRQIYKSKFYQKQKSFRQDFCFWQISIFRQKVDFSSKKSIFRQKSSFYLYFWLNFLTKDRFFGENSQFWQKI